MGGIEGSVRNRAKLIQKAENVYEWPMSARCINCLYNIRHHDHKPGDTDVMVTPEYIVSLGEKYVAGFYQVGEATLSEIKMWLADFGMEFIDEEKANYVPPKYTFEFCEDGKWEQSNTRHHSLDKCAKDAVSYMTTVFVNDGICIAVRLVKLPDTVQASARKRHEVAQDE